MKIKEFYHAPTYTLTYLVWDEDSKAAFVVDPVLDYDPHASQTSTTAVDELTAFIKDQGLALKYVFETHAHADHLTGAQLLRRRFDARVVIGGTIKKVQSTFSNLFNIDVPTDGSQFDILMADGDTIEVGPMKVEAIATPGHTPACMSYHVGDAVFTGDALFMPDYGTGRTDFPGGSAKDLYHSIHERLYTLPDDTRVFVGHDYQPGGRDVAFMTTIGESKAKNIHLKAETSESEYVNFRETRDATLSAPKLLLPSVQINIEAGRLPKKRENGNRYLHIPVNLFGPTDDIGEPESK